MNKTGSYHIFISFILAFTLFFAGTAAKSTKKTRTLQGYINSFETAPSETEIGDFDWETNGYVSLNQFKKYATKGKYSAQAIFSVPADFLSTTKAAKVKSWISSMTMSINTLTKLKVTDWSLYKKFAVDVYVPDSKARDIYIKLVDASGKEHVTLRPIKAGRNKLEVVLEDIKTARIDLSNIVALSIFMDTKDEEKDVTLFIDNVRIIP